MHTYKISIAVAERRPIVLSGLQNWFGAHERFHIVACAESGPALLAALISANHDLIVLSGGAEGSEADDFALLRELRRALPDTPVVVLTDERDPRAIAAIVRGGALGLVSTLDDARAFERVCDRVLSGIKHVVAPAIAASLQSADPAPASGPSPDYGNGPVNVRQFVGRY